MKFIFLNLIIGPIFRDSLEIVLKNEDVNNIGLLKHYFLLLMFSFLSLFYPFFNELIKSNNFVFGILIIFYVIIYFSKGIIFFLNIVSIKKNNLKFYENHKALLFLAIFIVLSLFSLLNFNSYFKLFEINSNILNLELFILLFFLLLIIYCKELKFKDLNNRKHSNIKIQNLSDILPQIKNLNADRQLIEFWENEDQIFLKNDFSLDRLAIILNMEKKNLVQKLYETYQLSFNDILNRYRIYNILLKIKLDTNKKKNIELIILENGYKNRSTFYLALKKITQLSPSEFINKNK